MEYIQNDLYLLSQYPCPSVTSTRDLQKNKKVQERIIFVKSISLSISDKHKRFAKEQEGTGKDIE
jgi:hypothetical protein